MTTKYASDSNVDNATIVEGSPHVIDIERPKEMHIMPDMHVMKNIILMTVLALVDFNFFMDKMNIVEMMINDIVDGIVAMVKVPSLKQSGFDMFRLSKLKVLLQLMTARSLHSNIVGHHQHNHEVLYHIIINITICTN